MRGSRFALIAILLLNLGLVAGCGSGKQELPTQERIQQQLKRDAAMREAEDRLEKEQRTGNTK
jgi:hypothetical protein